MLDSGAKGLADAFEGVWKIAREIDDRANGLTGSFRGHARLWPTLDGLVYQEDGDLVMGASAPMQAARKFIWQTQHSGQIDVFFGDGRYFHSFRPLETTCAAEHSCSPDHYAVTYEFALPNRWQSSWTVTGPRKNYRMTSAFAR